MKTRFIALGVVIVGILLVAPFSVAAATNTEIIAMMQAGLNSMRLLVQDAYCAAGINAFCP